MEQIFSEIVPISVPSTDNESYDFSWNDAMKIENDWGSKNVFNINKLKLKNLEWAKKGPWGLSSV